MAYVRRKKIGNNVYYYLVASYREGKRVRQRHLKYYGKHPPKGRQRGLRGNVHVPQAG